MFGPLASVASTKFGCGATAMVGGLLFGLGLFLSAYVDTIFKLYITYSVVVALGTCFTYYTSIFVLVDYFSKNLVVANGIAFAGVGFGTVTFAPAYSFLIEHFAWRVTFKVMSASSLILLFSGLLYCLVPAPRKQHVLSEMTTDRKLLDLSVFKNKAYLIWMLMLGLILFGYYVPYVHLVRHCQDLNIPKQEGAVLIGYIAISQTVGKIFFGRLGDHPRVNRLYLFQITLLVCSVVTTLLPILTSYNALVVYCWVYGLNDGCFAVLVSIITGDIVGKEKFTSALGLLYFVTGGSVMLGPLVAGWIYDLNGNYNPSFFMSGAFTVIGVSLVFLIPFLLPPEVEEEWNTRYNGYRYRLHSSTSNLSSDSRTKSSFFSSDTESVDKYLDQPKSVIVECEELVHLEEKSHGRLNMSLASLNFILDKYLSMQKRMSQYDALVQANYYNAELVWPPFAIERETVL